MSKIVIKEYDKTKTEVMGNNNFSVVVPGFVKEGNRIASTDSVTGEAIAYGYDDAGKSVFDENGIYICNSKANFEKYIGKVAGIGAGLAAKAPTIEVNKNNVTLTAEEFYVTYVDEIYTCTKITVAADKHEGYLRKLDGTDYYQYTRATTWSAETLYSVIRAGKEGWDAIAENYQYGNQIADLLLGLGYQVLYLNLNGDLANIAKAAVWEPLKDRSLYNFRYLLSGLLGDVGSITVANVNTIMTAIAENVINVVDETTNGRGDCIALLDIAKQAYMATPATTASAIAAIKANLGIQSTYCAYFAPSVFYSGIADEEYNNNAEFPASVHYLVCGANSVTRYPEWYAVSGYSRGVGAYNVVGTSVKLGDAAVNALQPRVKTSASGEQVSCAVNLIINLNGAYYLWGNRTGYSLDNVGLVASHFLNIRQLCCTLKKTIYTTCRQLVADPNSDVLWLNFCNSIRRVLDKMKANQGILDYKFEKKETSLKAKLFAAIRIVPIEAVEDFEIGLTLEDTLGDTVITIDEHLVN